MSEIEKLINKDNHDKTTYNNNEIIENRESLSMGTTKDFLGVEMTLGDIKNYHPVMLKNIITFTK